MTDAIVELNRALIAIINQSDLPMSAKYYVVKDIYHSTEKVYDEYLNLLKEQNKVGISDEEEHTIIKEYEIDNQTGEKTLLKKEVV